MGKVKLRDKRPNSSGHGKKAIQKLKKVLKPAAIAKKPAAATKKGHNPPQPKAQIPFTSEDRVLLVGEGERMSKSSCRFHNLCGRAFSLKHCAVVVLACAWRCYCF